MRSEPTGTMFKIPVPLLRIIVNQLLPTAEAEGNVKVPAPPLQIVN